MPTPEEIKAAEEKAAQEKKEADELAAKKAANEAANKIEIKDGKVSLSEKQYNDLLGMKDDMITYKEAKRKAESELEAKVAAELKAKEEQQIKDKKFEELYNQSKQDKTDMQVKFNDQEIISALTVKALEEGIVKGEYVKLIDKSKVQKNGDTGEISGIDEVIKSFKEKNPNLFKSESAPGVDTTHGGQTSGVMSDKDLIKLNNKELIELEKNNSGDYERWIKLATHGKPIPKRQSE